MISKHRRGHIYYRSPIESDDECGTCDGARCMDGNECRVEYDVWGIDKVFYSLEEAEAAEKALDEANESLFSLSTLSDEYNKPEFVPRNYTIVDGVLCIQVWKRPSFKGDNNWGWKYLPCNQESPNYTKIFEESQKYLDMYKECTCTDKDHEECNFLGCRDSSCYREMKAGKRTTKKWYM